MLNNIFNKKKDIQESKKYIHALEREDVLNEEELAHLKSNVLRAVSGVIPEGSLSRYKDVEVISSGSFWNWRVSRIWQYAAAIFVGISLVGGTVLASNASIPGDILYPVKIATETVVLKLAVTPVAQTQLKAQFAEDRIVELQKLAAKSVIASSQGGVNSNTQSFDKQEQISLQAKAKADAVDQVNQALTALQRQLQPLTTKGDIKTATDFSSKIKDLQNQAKSLNMLPTTPLPVTLPVNVDSGKSDITNIQNHNQNNKPSGNSNQTDTVRKTQRMH